MLKRFLSEDFILLGRRKFSTCKLQMQTSVVFVGVNPLVLHFLGCQKHIDSSQTCISYYLKFPPGPCFLGWGSGLWESCQDVFWLLEPLYFKPSFLYSSTVQFFKNWKNDMYRLTLTSARDLNLFRSFKSKLPIFTHFLFMSNDMSSWLIKFSSWSTRGILN